MLGNLFQKLKEEKDSGSVIGHMLPIIITTVVVGILAVMFTAWMSNVDRKNHLDVIARHYMLVMETTGGLRDDDKAEMLEKLDAAGLTNIDITGTTIKMDDPDTDVGYGQQINLVINGDMLAYNYEFLNLFSVNEKVETLPIHIVKVSTAKH